MTSCTIHKFVSRYLRGFSSLTSAQFLSVASARFLFHGCSVNRSHTSSPAHRIFLESCDGLRVTRSRQKDAVGALVVSSHKSRVAAMFLELSLLVHLYLLALVVMLNSLISKEEEAAGQVGPT